MSSNLMDTEKGGEQTQYEGEYTDAVPKSKSTGQFASSPRRKDGREHAIRSDDFRRWHERVHYRPRWDGGAGRDYGGKQDHNREIGA
ncbi:hypothetical protein BST61_g9366 [Cercospora zeina]